MEHVVCPKCQKRDMTQDAANPGIFTCSKCGKFILLPAEPNREDIPVVWDYLIQAGKHIKRLEQIGKI